MELGGNPVNSYAAHFGNPRSNLQCALNANFVLANILTNHKWTSLIQDGWNMDLKAANCVLLTNIF